MFKIDDISIGESERIYSRSFKAPLYCCVQSADDYMTIENFQIGMTSVLQRELGYKTHMKRASKLDCTSKGAFWSEYEKIAKKPYKRKNYVFPKGNKAKCFRMVSEQIRCQMLIKQEKQKVADIAKRFDYDSSRIDEILEACHDRDLYPTYWWLRDIIKTRGMSDNEIPKDLEFQIDWTTQDKQPIKCRIEGRFLYANCDYGGKWVEIKIPIPPYIKSIVSAFSNPVIYRDKDDVLWVRVCYDMIASKINPDSRCGGILGVDLGFVKAFAGSILYLDGSWRGELMPSKELKRVMEKHVLLGDECRALREKITAYKKLMGCEYREDESDEDRQKRSDAARTKINEYAASHPGFLSYEQMSRHLDDMCEDRKKKKSHLARLKEHEAWLYARDVIAHAIEWGVYEIHLEDLRAYRDVSGQWDFSKIAFCISNETELFGISVYVVNAKDTSHENPFSGEKCSLRDDRQMILGESDTIDRDLGASLNAGYCEPKRARIGSKNVAGSRTCKGSQRFWRDVDAASEERKERKALTSGDGDCDNNNNTSMRVRPVREAHIGDNFRRPIRSCFPRECLAALRSAGADGSGALISVASSVQPTITRVSSRRESRMRTATSLLVPKCLFVEVENP